MGHGAGAVAQIPAGYLVGAKAIRRAALADRPLRRLIVARDAPPSATEPVRRLAAERSWPVVEVASSVVLGRFCGLSRPVAAVAEVGVPLSRTKVPV